MAANPTKLSAQINDAMALGNDGNPATFAEWREASRAALKHAYPDDSSEVERFDKISYSLGFFTDRTPQSAFDDEGQRATVGAISRQRRSALWATELHDQVDSHARSCGARQVVHRPRPALPLEGPLPSCSASSASAARTLARDRRRGNDPDDAWRSVAPRSALWVMVQC